MTKNKVRGLVPFLLFLILGIGQAFAAWDGTTKTAATLENGYYIIDTEAKLAWFADQVNGGHSNYNAKLTADLDLAHQSWTPIGVGEKTFAGTFDGGNHVVSNLYINAEDIIEKFNGDKTKAKNLGFIGNFSGTVQNLILENVEILGYGSGIIKNNHDDPVSIGAVVGWQNGRNSLIEGCAAAGQITTSGKGQAVGGLVGSISNGVVRNCISSVNMDANGDNVYVGGIVGDFLDKKGVVNISSCVYAGEVLSANGNESAVGAVAGRKPNGNNGSLTLSAVYYDEELGSGIGSGGSVSGISAVEDVNAETVACTLNGGQMVNGACSKDSPWAVGESSLILNGYGSDGVMVTFDAKSGSFPGGAKTKKLILKGKTITPEEISIPVHADSAFAGWSLNKNATEPDADLGSVSASVTIYAVWYPIFTITFSAAPGTYADGQTVVKTVKVAKGDMISVTGMDVPATYVKNGTTLYFTGWSNEQKEFEANYDITASDTLHLDGLVATGNMTFYAAWTKAQTFTVTYNANGHGKTKIDFVNVEKGEKITEPPAPTPNAGYVYSGWCMDSTCETSFSFETEIDSNYVLYANWEAEEYSITYNLDGGTNNGANPASYTIESATIVLQDPVKEGFAFDGWFYDPDFAESAKQITTGTTGDKSLYAQWSAKTYSIKYNSGADGTGLVSAETKTHGEAYTLRMASYTRNGYGQDGWSTSDGGEKAYDLGATYTGNADLTLYPHWEAGLIEVEKFGGITVYVYADHKEAVIDGTSLEALDIPKDIDVTSVRLERTFEIGKNSTIVLPFDITVAKTSGGNFNILSSISDDFKMVTLGQKTEQLHAYEPYVVLADKPALTFEGPVTLKKTVVNDTQIPNSDWYFKAAYEKIVFGEREDLYGRAYGFAGAAVDGFTVGQFVKAGKKAWVGPMKAYLVYTGELNRSASKSAVGAGLAGELPDEINVVIQDEQGNIVERGVMNTRTGEFRMDRWYDLQGRRLNSKPTVQGTYYHNGKRVIVK